MDEKYIELLLTKCTDFNKSKILFICYDIEVEEFVQKLIKKASAMGIEEFGFEKINLQEDKKILKKHTLEQLKENNFFDRSIWDEYAKKKANFLIIDTEQPHIMDDIESEKIALMSKQSRESRPLYRKMVEHCEIPWCIAAYPGKLWAQEIFKDDKESYKKLKEAIEKACMLNNENPILSWERQIEKTNKIIDKLNDLSLNKLIYKNKMGTNLTVYLPENYQFASAEDENVIVNMPSYEIFTSPIYNKTEGIVYSTMPLCYNGKIVDDFYIEFKEGKVINYDAKIGKDILKEIIESDNNSCYLGECALVEYNSPISKLGIVFQTTLIDENASCHLALGSGFPECIKDGLNMSDNTLLSKGINISKNHVDFMIGSSDLTITGITKDSKEVPIFVNGNFHEEFRI